MTIATRCFRATVIIVALAGFGLAHSARAQSGSAPAWNVPDVKKLGDDAWGKLVRLGRDLTSKTPELIGPEVADVGRRYAGSNLTCQNCHLEEGAKKFGLPYAGVFGDFPQYRAREGEVGTIEDRINGCMIRSMNGRALPLDSIEMKAMAS